MVGMITKEDADYVNDFFNSVLNKVQDNIRIDNRNFLLVYNPRTCPHRFIELVKNKLVMVINGANYVFVSEDEWATMELGKLKIDTDSSFFDEEYYKPGIKGTYSAQYTWKVEGDSCIKRTTAITDLFHPSSFLDIGCAKGFLLKAMMSGGVNDVQGIDISQWAIDNCEPEVKGKLQQFDLNSEKNLPFPDNRFDVVYSESVMEHVEESAIPHCFKEMYRVTKKWVLMSIPVDMSNVSRPWGDVSHKTFLCPSWWIKVAHEAGLLYDWRYSKFVVYKHDISMRETGLFVFAKDKLDAQYPWEKLGIKINTDVAFFGR